MQTEEIIVNMGPQHPSTHGVLRLLITLSGERLTNVESHIGYLHRGIEKLAESKTYSQFIPITDRLDYLAAPSNNLAYVLACEQLLEIDVPRRANFIRVILAELARITSHLVWYGTHALDLGAYTPFLYSFREREAILDLFEEYCGSRMTTSCMRIGGVFADLPSGFMEKLERFVNLMPSCVDEYESLLTTNRIWLKRTKGIGIISPETALNWGITGPSLRASGVNWDIRKAQPYCIYDELEFDVPQEKDGDVYARYLIRLKEIRQSVRILKQILEKIPEGEIFADVPQIVLPPKVDVLNHIEALIHHFNIIVKGISVPPKEVYVPIEAPKGELGFYIVSDGSALPYRLKIRAPSFVNLQILPEISRGLMLADLVACIGSLDPVMGEVDR